MKLIVGLGNPGAEYAYTYHNVGWLTLDILAEHFNIKLNEKVCDSIVGVKSVKGEKIILAKPQTYMNLSGTAVKQLMSRYGAKAEDLIVIYDDIDIAKGTFRYRIKGSAGTHNGMRNIIAQIGTENFQRVRVGIGPVPEQIPLISYVLMTIPDDERSTVAQGAKDGVNKILQIIGC